MPNAKFAFLAACHTAEQNPEVTGLQDEILHLAGAMQFIFSHGGRTLEPDQTPEEAGIEDGDVILAVEMMDLTDGPGTEELDEGQPEPVRRKLRKEWVEDPTE